MQWDVSPGKRGEYYGGNRRISVATKPAKADKICLRVNNIGGATNCIDELRFDGYGRPFPGCVDPVLARKSLNIVGFGLAQCF